MLQTYSQLAHPIQQAKALGLQFHSRILDIDNVDVSDFLGGLGVPWDWEGILISMRSELPIPRGVPSQVGTLIK